MNVRLIFGLLFAVLITVLIEVGVYKAIHLFSKGKHKFLKNTLFFLSILIPYSILLIGILNRDKWSEPSNMNTAAIGFGILMMFISSKIIIALFHFLNQINHKLRQSVKGKNQKKITRSKFLTMSGFALASIPFTSFLYGMVIGRYRFRILKEEISIQNLPNSFEGLKIIQLSDMHLGSFPQNETILDEAIKMINDLEADYIFFTGDMVNERAIEAEFWIKKIAQLNAKSGKFSVLGNHDYGDYYEHYVGKPEKIEENVSRLQAIQEKMGFQLLRNENILLKKGNESIRLIGLENWGAGHFSKYGDLDKATQGVNNQEVQILLSHDPSHWDEQVLNKTNIDLSLAGHTHGCQMGVETAGFQFSPVQFRYPRWGGLYKENKQQLYVNRGFGYIGYAGRVGMDPEITLLTLKKA